jgi:myo-inositol-1(or 4)-monophosphatase
MLTIEQRQSIKAQIKTKLKEHLIVQVKDDKTFVTDIDLFISNLIKSYLPSEVCFYSEEEYSEFKYPCVILDPIDGTKELVHGIGECALSFLYLESEDLSQSFAWIYNPFTGFEIASDDPFTPPKTYHDSALLGLVSSSEWKKGLYTSYQSQEIILAPRGSIAFKLALLASGACDFVITKKPKNIWDIAAGTALCLQRGYKFFDQGIEKKTFSQMKYLPNLIWCRNNQEFEKLAAIFS